MDFFNDLTKKDWIILGIGLTVGAVLMYGYNRYCQLYPGCMGYKLLLTEYKPAWTKDQLKRNDKNTKTQ